MRIVDIVFSVRYKRAHAHGMYCISIGHTKLCIAFIYHLHKIIISDLTLSPLFAFSRLVRRRFWCIWVTYAAEAQCSKWTMIYLSHEWLKSYFFICYDVLLIGIIIYEYMDDLMKMWWSDWKGNWNNCRYSDDCSIRGILINWKNQQQCKSKHAVLTFRFIVSNIRWTMKNLLLQQHYKFIHDSNETSSLAIDDRGE